MCRHGIKRNFLKFRPGFGLIGASREDALHYSLSAWPEEGTLPRLVNGILQGARVLPPVVQDDYPYLSGIPISWYTKPVRSHFRHARFP
jgi:hypothetical protein